MKQNIANSNPQLEVPKIFEVMSKWTGTCWYVCYLCVLKHKLFTQNLFFLRLQDELDVFLLRFHQLQN